MSIISNLQTRKLIRKVLRKENQRNDCLPNRHYGGLMKYHYASGKPKHLKHFLFEFVKIDEACISGTKGESRLVVRVVKHKAFTYRFDNTTSIKYSANELIGVEYTFDAKFLV